MNRKGVVSDAWDDDWVSKADVSVKLDAQNKSDTPQQPSLSSEPPPTGTRISKAERRAKQAELNRKLWEEA